MASKLYSAYKISFGSPILLVPQPKLVKESTKLRAQREAVGLEATQLKKIASSLPTVVA
jgi:hypothetical protein